MSIFKSIYKKQLIRQVTNSSTDYQLDFLSESLRTGHLSKFKLREQLERQAHVEMAKGKNKLENNGQKVTVEALLEEYYKEKKFQKLSSDVGLDENWFINLAKSVLPKETK